MSLDADTRLSFDNVPEIYDRARPEYPRQAFDHLFAYLRERTAVEAPRIVEIGPGTGQATRALLEYGAVTAVEIGPRMAAFLRDKFRTEPRLQVINSAFEDVDLPATDFEVVFAATAFHWLDASMGLRKACGLLTTGGVLATLSTIQVRSDADLGYFDRTQPVYQRYNAAGDHHETLEPQDATPSEYAEFRSSRLLQEVQVKRYRWDQTYSTDQYEALVRSYSGTNMMDVGAREGLIRDLREVIDREYGGKVTRPVVIALTMARRRDDADGD